MSPRSRTATLAWLLTAIYYFYQYTLRSAPAVMMPELSTAFAVSTTAVASMVGIFYYGYSPFSLIAGAAMDRIGPRRVVPIGAAIVGVGALLFGSGNPELASPGRFLQGAGGAFRLVGAPSTRWRTRGCGWWGGSRGRGSGPIRMNPSGRHAMKTSSPL